MENSGRAVNSRPPAQSQSLRGPWKQKSCIHKLRLVLRAAISGKTSRTKHKAIAHHQFISLLRCTITQASEPGPEGSEFVPSQVENTYPILSVSSHSLTVAGSLQRVQSCASDRSGDRDTNYL